MPNPFGDTPVAANPFGDTPVTQAPEKPEYNFEPITPNDPEFGSVDPTEPAIGAGIYPTPRDNSPETKKKQYTEIKNINKLYAQDALGGRVNLDRTLDSFDASYDAGRNLEIKDQIKKLQEKYPGADVKAVTQKDGERVFIRLPDDKEYVPLEPYSVFDPQGSYAATAGKVAGAVVNEENVLSTAGAIATRGASLPVRVGVSAVSSAFGNFVKQFTEKKRGYQDKINTNEVATQGALGAAGDVLGSTVQAGRNLFRSAGRNAGFSSEVADAAMRTRFPAQGGGTQEFPMSLDMAVPQMRRMMNQLEQFGFKGVTQQKEGQKEAILYSLDKTVREGTVAGKEFLDSENLPRLQQNMESRTYQESGLTNPNARLEDTTPNIQRSLEGFKDFSKKELGTAYDTLLANMPEGATIDLSAAQNAIRESLDPVKFKGKPVVAGSPSGLPVVTDTEEAITKDLSSGFKDLLAKVKNIDPNVAEYKDKSAFEQIKQLRSQIADYAFPQQNSLVTGTGDQQVASRLYGALTDAMENVKFPPNTPPGFVQTWQATNAANKQFRTFMDQPHIKEMLDTSTPGGIASKLTPENFNIVHDLHKSLPKDDFEQNVAGNFKQQLYDNPGEIQKKLSDWASKSPKTLDLLIPRAEQAEWKMLGKEWTKLQSSKVYNWMKTYGTMSERASELAVTSPEELARFIETDQSGMFKKVVGLGFATNAIEQSITYVNGKRLLNPGKALANFNLLETHGLLNTKYMTLDQLDRVKDQRTLLSAMAGGSADSGASLEAASDIASLTDITRMFTSPVGYASDVMSLVGKSRVAALVTSDTAQKLMKGRGTRLAPVQMPATRATTISMINFMQEINHEAEDLVKGPKPILDITKYPDLTLDDAMALRGKFTIDQKAMDKLRQNQNMKHLEDQLKRSKKPDIKGGVGANSVDGGSAFDVLQEDPYAEYASLDTSGNFQELPEQDRLRYMEEDVKDKAPTTPAPLPKAPGKPVKKMVAEDKTQLKTMLGKMSKTIGLRENLLEKIATAESNLGQNTQASTSSARGLFQFTSGTWKEMVKKYGDKTGITEADIDNENANAVMGALYLHQNTQALTKKLGRKLTDAEVYATHFMGLSGAEKLVNNYKANPIAATVFPAAAEVNKPIFYHPDKKGKPDLTKPRTIRQVYHVLAEKVD